MQISELSEQVRQDELHSNFQSMEKDNQIIVLHMQISIEEVEEDKYQPLES